MTNALKARNARNGNVLSPWDGRLEPDIPRVAVIGTRGLPDLSQRSGNLGNLPVQVFP